MIRWKCITTLTRFIAPRMPCSWCAILWWVWERCWHDDIMWVVIRPLHTSVWSIDREHTWVYSQINSLTHRTDLCKSTNQTNQSIRCITTRIRVIPRGHFTLCVRWRFERVFCDEYGNVVNGDLRSNCGAPVDVL